MNQSMHNTCRIIFLDIVGFSKKNSNIQKQLIQKLSQIITNSPQIKKLATENLVQLPTGDGVALAIWSDPQTPLMALFEIHKAIKEHNIINSEDLKIEVRTGINSGEIFTVLDINERRNIVGEGINNAQRVMDFGDSGHILASQAIADELLQVCPSFSAVLHDLGLFADKHGIQHQVYNIFTWEIGNPALPIRNRKISDESVQVGSQKHIWQQLLELARWEVKFLKHATIEPDHFFLALLKLKGGLLSTSLKSQNLDSTSIRRNYRRQLGKGSTELTRDPIFSKPLNEYLESIWTLAANEHRDITEKDFIFNLLNSEKFKPIQNFLQYQGINISSLLNQCCPNRIKENQKSPEIASKLWDSNLLKSLDLSSFQIKETSTGNEYQTPPDQETIPLGQLPADSIKVSLKIENGSQTGKEFEFSDSETFIVGRAQNANFVLDHSDSSVSRKHFMVEIVPPKCYLRDFNSTNGTFVNGQKIQQTELKNEDIIRAGKTEISVHITSICSVSKIFCTRCGLPYTPISESDKICEACQKEIEQEANDKLAATQVPIQANCKECNTRMSQCAGSDGKGQLLEGIATYLCKSCFDSKYKQTTRHSVGKYQLLRQLGQGGMGAVFLVWNSMTGRIGALKKILLPEPDQKIARRFIRETRIMNALKHPNIVRIFEDGVYENAPYFVSEFLEGGCLGKFLTGCNGKLSINLALKITSEILKGLEFLHQSGHVHRDIKPSNILLSGKTPDTILPAKISDFGLAKSFVGVGGTKLTKANEFAGSLYYTPPEQIINFSKVGPTADIYSAGVTLYQMITGKLPYNFNSHSGARSLKDSLLIVLEEPVIPIRKRSPQLSPELATIIDKATAKRPEDRYQTAALFNEAIKGYLRKMQ